MNFYFLCSIDVVGEETSSWLQCGDVSLRFTLWREFGKCPNTGKSPVFQKWLLDWSHWFLCTFCIGRFIIHSLGVLGNWQMTQVTMTFSRTAAWSVIPRQFHGPLRNQRLTAFRIRLRETYRRLRTHANQKMRETMETSMEKQHGSRGRRPTLSR